VDAALQLADDDERSRNYPRRYTLLATYATSASLLAADIASKSYLFMKADYRGRQRKPDFTVTLGFCV